MENAGTILPPDMNNYGSDVALSNKFPGKLWRMVNNCKSGAISWGQGGRTVIIHQSKFQDEFLNEGNGLFKTANIGSFIRQLNLYGFRKLNVLRYTETGSEYREIHEFQSDSFIQGRPELLSRLRRNVGIRRSREAGDVQRQLDEIHGYANKKHYLEMQNGNYLTFPTSYGQRVHVPPSAQGQQGEIQTTTSQWPVYMHWDGHGYKYVVNPEMMEQKASAGKSQLQSLLHPSVRTKQSSDGETFQVLHIPETGAGEPAKEYYLLSLMSEDTSSTDNEVQQQQQEPESQQQLDNNFHTFTQGHGRGSESVLAQNEYTQAELYQLADMLASNPQCAIAAAQQLLAQATQDPSIIMSDKPEVTSDCWLSPPTSPPCLFSDIKLEAGSVRPEEGIITDVKLEPADPSSSEESPFVVMPINDMSPRVIVTTNEDTCKSPNLHNLFQYSHGLEQAFLPPQEEEEDEEEDPLGGMANRSLNLIMN